MGTVAQEHGPRYTAVSSSVLTLGVTLTEVLDKNHTGMISIQQIAKDPLF